MQHTVSPAAVDNSLSPHGGRLIERVATRQEIKEKWPSGLAALPSLAVRDQIARSASISPMGFSRLWRGSWARWMWMRWPNT